LIVTLSEAMTKLAVSLSTAPGCLTMNTSFTAPQQLNNRFNEPFVQYGGIFTTKSVLSGGFDVSSSLIA